MDSVSAIKFKGDKVPADSVKRCAENSNSV